MRVPGGHAVVETTEVEQKVGDRRQHVADATPFADDQQIRRELRPDDAAEIGAAARKSETAAERQATEPLNKSSVVR